MVVEVAQPFGFRRECDGLLARAPEGSGEGEDARGLPTAGQGWVGAAGEAGRLAGARISWCCGELAGRSGRIDVHSQTLGVVAELGSLPVTTNVPSKARTLECSSVRDASATGGMGRWPCAAPLGSAHDGTEFSQVDGLAGSLDAKSHLRRRSRSTRKTGGVEWSRPLPLTSNDS